MNTEAYVRGVPPAEWHRSLEPRTWTVELDVFEDEHGTTRAEAGLRIHAAPGMLRRPASRSDRSDGHLPRTGDALAACRALSGLAHDLLEAAIVDLQQDDAVTGRTRFTLQFRDREPVERATRRHPSGPRQYGA